MSPYHLPATLMRGGIGKGRLFHHDALPAAGAARDTLLLRAPGSPDPYGKQIDRHLHHDLQAMEPEPIASSTGEACFLPGVLLTG